MVTTEEAFHFQGCEKLLDFAVVFNSIIIFADYRSTQNAVVMKHYLLFHNNIWRSQNVLERF